MISGVKIDLGGREFEVPALTIDQLETFEEDIARASSAALNTAENFGKERLAAMARVIHGALSRNYPELALEEARKLLDLGNIGRAWAAVMGVSGLSEKEPGVGEAKAEAAAGTTSAQASVAEPAGPGAIPAS